MRGFGHRIGVWLRIPGHGAQRVLVVLVVFVLAAGIGVAVALSAPALRERLGVTAATTSLAATPLPAPPDTPAPALRSLPPDAPLPSEAELGRVLDSRTASGLAVLGATVLDAATGTPLWSHDPGRALVPGSTAKLLTASAVLLALDHQARLHTTVLAGTAPGAVVLVGGGDPTLSALPAGEESVYPGAARLDDLAAQVRGASSEPVTSVVVDVDRYAGAGLAPGWLPSDVPGGFVAPIVPLMLDGGRADPTAQDGTRTTTPAQDAGRELARRLGTPNAPVRIGSAVPGARVLGSVASPPVSELVATALRVSDNVLAEALAREVARATGAEPSFAGAAAALTQVLRGHGFDVSDVSLVDGSGLSTEDRLPARLLGALVVAAAGPADARGAALRPLLDGLPVAGGTGTLGDRFPAEGEASAGRGFVRAKTGTLTTVSSLAGVVLDVDGRLLVFALVENGVDPATARPRLDGVAAALRGCGCR